MTKSFEKITVEALHGLDYSKAVANMELNDISESRDTSVLDLSFKRSSPSPTASDYLKAASISPIRESSNLEHQETNNNDNKHTNGYQQNEPLQTDLTHRYQPEEASTFPSNHERTSPFENRSYVMTPPSETDSPKKPRFQAIYDHTNIMNESRRHPVYPTAMMPINVPMPLPISVPSVLPSLLPRASPVSSSVPMMLPAVSSPASHEVSQATVAAEEAKKAPRPFKAYPKDPLSITLGPDMMFDQELKKAYSDFRSRMLDSVKRTNEGTNIKMRRVNNSPLPTSPCDEKDAAYWERRRKNNEAAKRSRDARRAKEDEIAIRAAFLEQEYIRLKYENAVLKDENAKIKCLLYGH